MTRLLPRTWFRLILVLALACLLPAAAAHAQPPTLVISQVYGGGGNSGATYKNDFIEIYNLGSTPVSVTGWSVQYASSTGTTWQVTLLGGTILPGRFYLVQEAAGTGGSVNLPTPDATGPIAMSATNGKVALVSSTTALSGACPASAAIVDFVGFGAANCSETSPTAALSNTTAAIRNGNGATDTNNNLADFTIGLPRPRNSANIQLSGSGSANPAELNVGTAVLLAVSVTPGTDPASTDIVVTANLTSIGGSASQTFYDDGTNGDAVLGDGIFSFNTAVGMSVPTGTKTLPVTIADAQGRNASTTITLTVVAPPTPSMSLVISQVYGGGGNSGATLKNDFIEIYNLGTTAVNVTGWSVQYGSATGASWQVTQLSGTILPGRFYLVQEAAGTATGSFSPLPTPDATGTINMGAASGKVALSSSTAALSGACPVSAALVDLVGYGGANCSETSPTPTLSATTAAIRNGNGSIDTNNNLNDFTVGAPAPSNGSGRPPVGAGAAVPASLSAGESSLLTVSVTPGSLPASSTFTVGGDLSAVGGSATQAFFDDGTHGDAAAGDNVFSFLAAVPVSATLGAKTLPITVSDELARSSTTNVTLIVEPAIVAIHDIQGPSNMSPLNGQLVATKGIVTGRTYNGFYIQAPAGDVDADASTSEGIFIYTGTSTTLATGTYVKVAGTVSEFAPPSDPLSPPITEIGSSTVTVLATGQPLPPPATITAADTNPASFTNLERFEGMLVHIDALRVIAPTQAAFVTESTALSTSNGVFYGVVDGVARPFREPGIPLIDQLPTGWPCCMPRFDENPERLRIDSDGQDGASPIEVTAGALVSNLTGPLTFSYRTWTILPDPAAPPAVSGLASAVPVPAPADSEFTVGAFNLQGFFDTESNSSAPVLTPTAFANRLNKASLAIRNVMRAPDILGVEEVENLATLQELAAKINSDAAAAGQPVPGYVVYLEEGNDVGGIDVGFLVKNARVSVVDVTQVGKTATYINPTTGKPELLNDRPPLVLRARIQGPIGTPFPVTVIVNHLRSLNGVEDPVDGRVRAKRAAQAEFLANLVQARQEADPTERIVSVGDYNAFAVNDGYVDVMGTVKGVPTPPDQVVQASPPLLDPVLTNLVDLLPQDQAYSYSFDGNTQAIDHITVNGSLMKRYSRFHYARNNADFPESYRNDPDRPERLSDHDMPVAYFAFPGAPTLTLNGPNPMQVECCTAFTDPGASASDTDLGDITSSIVVTGSVDSTKVGSYILTYEVSNGFVTTTMTRTVNVVDTTPPVLTLNGGSVMTIELGGTYIEPGATSSDTCAGSLTVQVAGTVNTGAVGSYALHYTASDGYTTTSVTRIVNVVDTTPPAIATVSTSPHVLWPPLGQLVPVNVTVSATDLGGAPACRITSVSSDEPVRKIVFGKALPAWEITGPHSLMLRAERDGFGDGRVYTITVTCTDPAGNASTGTGTVLVPHDLRR